ncbi:unnamed protein product [Chrysodeixis includens]|uniref:Uncharacterized protein n=1 Tax=Chrysodeixis includens TaxID=689277 RepID=A0A9N8Q0A9_CHRIL|nr:unnamed protein product [Chrysodeixis includens]
MRGRRSMSSSSILSYPNKTKRTKIKVLSNNISSKSIFSFETFKCFFLTFATFTHITTNGSYEYLQNYSILNNSMKLFIYPIQLTINLFRRIQSTSSQNHYLRIKFVYSQSDS